jgi:ABC-type lipoprotein export system ATPase subunit
MKNPLRNAQRLLLTCRYPGAPCRAAGHTIPSAKGVAPGRVDASAPGRALSQAESRDGLLIQLNGVSRTFARGHVRALRKLSLSVGQSDYLAITGPSGSGKSTLLYLASGLDQPDSGNVLFAGSSPTRAEWTRLRATRIGFVFQSYQLVAGLTAAENIELPMLGVVAGEGDRLRRVAALLSRVGLGGRTHHRVSELSGGEAQRVAIARALANSPSVLLADEPTGNLDSRTADEILKLLEDMHESEKVALVIVTHDAQIAQRAFRVVNLLDGEIVSETDRRERI